MNLKQLNLIKKPTHATYYVQWTDFCLLGTS